MRQQVIVISIYEPARSGTQFTYILSYPFYRIKGPVLNIQGTRLLMPCIIQIFVLAFYWHASCYYMLDKYLSGTHLIQNRYLLFSQNLIYIEYVFLWNLNNKGRINGEAEPHRKNHSAFCRRAG